MLFHVWLVYLITDVILSMTPGPAVLLVSSQGMKYGKRPSYYGALGISSANFFYFILSALGLSALLLRAVFVFTVIKICGAGYLIVLGLFSIVATFKIRHERSQPPVERITGIRNTFMQAFVTQISNPKAIIFFASLVPQFIDPRGNIALQFSILALTTIIPETCILIGYGWLGARGNAAIEKNPALPRWIDRIAGAVLIAIGINLLFIRTILP